MPESRLVLRVWRSARPGRDRAGFDELAILVDRERDTVLDAIERVWAEVDRTLVFRHACHHASCGTCAVRVNGRECLPCITPLSSVWNGHARLTVEPLRNVPLVADLAVDPTDLIGRMAALRLPYVRTVEAQVRCAAGIETDGDVGAAERFEDCLECFACVSACPVASADPAYLGPAILAGAARIAEEPRHGDPARVLDLVDTEHGIWQCRSVWACTAVCPSGVDPAVRIMDLRQRVLTDSRAAVPAEVGP